MNEKLLAEIEQICQENGFEGIDDAYNHLCREDGNNPSEAKSVQIKV